MPTFGSLFAGVGGIDLGLERAGWTGRWQVEWDGFCSTSLARNYPTVVRRGDVTAVDFRGLERVDLIAGGFPCQPISVAGKQKAQADERWLWPEFARAIREVGPSFVLVENVRNLLAIDGGGPFGEVLGTLDALGYDAEWDCLPAAAFGAPHERDRLFLLAYPKRDRGDGIADAASWDLANGPDAERREASGGPALGGQVADPDRIGVRVQPVTESGRGDPPLAGRHGPTVADDDGWRREEQRSGGLSGIGDAPLGRDFGRRGGAGHVADADGLRGGRRGAGPSEADGGRSRSTSAGSGKPLADPDDLDAQGQLGQRHDPAVGEVAAERSAGLRGGTGRHRFGAPQSRVVRAPDGLPSWMDGHLWPAPPGPQYDWEPPRTVQGRHPNRAKRVKALGNAVVPQIPEHIGRLLLEAMENVA